MQELVNLVAQRAGIAPDKAEMAVQAVLGYMRDRIPPQFAGYIDQVAGGKDLKGAGGGAMDMLGGIFGKK
jgi:hypothetical protein